MTEEFPDLSAGLCRGLGAPQKGLGEFSGSGLGGKTDATGISSLGTWGQHGSSSVQHLLSSIIGGGRGSSYVFVSGGSGDFSGEGESIVMSWANLTRRRDNQVKINIELNLG